MTDDQEPDDYATGTVSLEVGTKELRGEEVRTLDIAIQVPDAVLEEVRQATQDRIDAELPENAPDWMRCEPEDYPGLFRDHLNERLRIEYANADLPDACTE